MNVNLTSKQIMDIQVALLTQIHCYYKEADEAVDHQEAASFRALAKSNFALYDELEKAYLKSIDLPEP